MHNQLATSLSQMQSLESQLTIQAATLESIPMLEQQLTEMCVQLNDETEERKAAQQHASQLSEESTEQRRTIERMRAELADVKATVSTLKESIAELQRGAETARCNEEHARKLESELRNQISNLNHQLSDSAAQLAAAQSNLELKTAKLHSLQLMHDELQQNAAMESKNEVEKMKEELKRVQAQLEEAKQREVSYAAMEANLKNQLNDLESELTRQKREYESHWSEREAEMERILAQRSNDAEKSVAQLHATQSQVAATEATLRETITRLQAELSAAKATHVESLLAAHKQSNELLSVERDRLEQLSAELSATKERAAAANQELSKYMQRLHKSQERLLKLGKERQEMKSELRSAKAHNDGMKEENRRLRKQWKLGDASTGESNWLDFDADRGRFTSGFDAEVSKFKNSSSSRDYRSLVDHLKHFSLEHLVRLKRTIADDRASLVKQIQNLQHTIDHLLDQQHMLLANNAEAAANRPLLLSASQALSQKDAVESNAPTPRSATFAPAASQSAQLATERELASLQRAESDWKAERAVLLEQREELLAQLKRFADLYENSLKKKEKKKQKEQVEKDRRELERKAQQQQLDALQAQLQRKEEQIQQLVQLQTSVPGQRHRNGGELRVESLDTEGPRSVHARAQSQSQAPIPAFAATSPLPDAWNGDYDALLQHYHSTRDQLIAAQVSLQTSDSSFAVERAALQRERDRAEAEVREHQRRLQAAMDEASAARTAQRQSQDEMARMEQRMRDLQSQLDLAQHDLAHARAQVQSAESSRHPFSSSDQTELVELRRQKSKLEDVIQSQSKEIDEFKRSLNKADAAQREQVETSRQELLATQKKLEAANTRIRQLEHNSEAELWRQRADEHGARVQQLHAALNRSERECASLRTQLSEREDEVARLQRRHNEVRRSVSRVQAGLMRKVQQLNDRQQLCKKQVADQMAHALAQMQREAEEQIRRLVTAINAQNTRNGGALLQLRPIAPMTASIASLSASPSPVVQSPSTSPPFSSPPPLFSSSTYVPASAHRSQRASAHPAHPSTSAATSAATDSSSTPLTASQLRTAPSSAARPTPVTNTSTAPARGPPPMSASLAAFLRTTNTNISARLPAHTAAGVGHEVAASARQSTAPTASYTIPASPFAHSLATPSPPRPLFTSTPRQHRR